MEGISEELLAKLLPIVHDNDLTIPERVNKVMMNRSYLSREQVAKLFKRSVYWIKTQEEKFNNNRY